jgi:ABC-type uncharacterized transport system substrate-binding protein
MTPILCCRFTGSSKARAMMSASVKALPAISAVGNYAIAGAIVLTSWAGMSFPALAHPHVMVEANLEILRDKDGAATQLRHVWRFDELFSSSVLLDFDANADGQLDASELDEVSKVVTESIGENGFFTEVRLAGKPVHFKGPDIILVDYDEDQLLMFFAVTFDTPIPLTGEDFKVSVSDPSYYVAIDIPDESAVTITGGGPACAVQITTPDFDKLIADNKAEGEKFFADPQNASLGDEWKTWIGLRCE